MSQAERHWVVRDNDTGEIVKDCGDDRERALRAADNWRDAYRYRSFSVHQAMIAIVTAS